MNRRSFLASSKKKRYTPAVHPVDDQIQIVRPIENPFANKTLPRVARTQAGMEPYAGPWGYDQVAHLLRRTMFGATRGDTQGMLSLTMNQVVAQLLADQPAPDPPVNTNALDVDVPIGQPWVTSPKTDSNAYNPNNSRDQSLKSWWIGLMLGQPVSIREKMVLFWHNHFVTDTVDVGDARYSYKNNALLRQFALGNIKELAYQITIDPAMLKYLSGSTSTKASPNENYGRELQELFTIGKGPEIAPGNYTNYTEDDVKAAAKVLTGWRDDSTAINSYFTLSRHDITNKQFSSAYGNTIITGKSSATRPNEVDDLLTMIFAQEETARYICRKLYRWFVYYLIDDVVETNVIEPMASLLRANNFEIKPVLQALFTSAHFYDPINIGCIIKNPIDLAVGVGRQFAVAFPSSSDVTQQYTHWNYIRTQASNMQLNLGDPPNVAGWPAYYQVPQFYELWLNSDTLPKRNQLTDTLIGKGFKSNNYTLVIDPIAFADQVSDPSDPNILIDEFAQILFPIAITANQKAFLKETLIPGLPDYEWTVEWSDYKANQADQAKLTAVKTKLQALVKLMMDMAEYQLM